MKKTIMLLSAILILSAFAGSRIDPADISMNLFYDLKRLQNKTSRPDKTPVPDKTSVPDNTPIPDKSSSPDETYIPDKTPFPVNTIEDRSDDFINPEHSIVRPGSVVKLTAPAGTNDGKVYSFIWQLVHKPPQSRAALKGANAHATSIAPDAEGFYLIRLTIIKGGRSIGSDFAYVGTPSVTRYVHAGARGSNTGVDWQNAFPSLPKMLTRGYTYYIADGIYPGYSCNTPSDSAIPIYIKKATGADHGTETGWNPRTMGGGQAVFLTRDPIDLSGRTINIPFVLNANYVIIDGQTGKDNGVREKHGIKFFNSISSRVPAGNHAFVVGDGINGNPATVNNIKIKSCEMVLPGCNNSKIQGHGFVANSMVKSLQYCLLKNCYIHDVPGMPVYFFNTQHSIVHGCYIARNHSDAVSHSEGIQTNPNCAYNIVRYNVFEDIEGTAIIVGDTGWEVYGNLAFYTRAYVDKPSMGRHAPNVNCSNFVGMGFYTTTAGGSRGYNKVYNNTIVGNNRLIARDPSNTNGGNLGLILTGPGNIVFNNIWANCRYIFISREAQCDYNMFYNNGTDSGSYSELHIQKTATDPFVNAATHDYRLTRDTNAGNQVGDFNSYDRYGKKRGSSGNWSRGAFQY